MSVSPITRVLYAAQDGICAGCRRRMNPLKKGFRVGDPGLNATRDHVIPRGKGGSDDIFNQVALCQRCNGAKGDRLPTGCEIITMYVVQAALQLDYMHLVAALSPRRHAATLADVWPSAPA